MSDRSTKAGGARSRARGSSVSDKQVAFAVRDGKKVTATLHSGQSVQGYVIGIDDYHWVLIDEWGHVTLVHKTVPALAIATSASLSGEIKAVQDAAAPFRHHIEKTYFHSTRQNPEEN